MPRQEFSRKIRRTILDRANGKCEACGATLKVGEGEIDHILPDALGGEPVVSNGRLLCRVCHTAKTADDIRRIRKSDRQRDKASGALKSKSPMSKRPKQPKVLSKQLPIRRGGVAAQYKIKDQII